MCHHLACYFSNIQNGATMPNPPDDICEPGNWCDGKDAHQCPVGTYNGIEGGRTELDCTPCPSGYYCEYTGTIYGNLTLCTAGNFCPIGTKDPEDFPCPGR